MGPVKNKPRDPRTSGQKAVSIHIKNPAFFKRCNEDPEVKRAFIKGMKGLLGPGCTVITVLFQKSEKQDDTDTTILTAMINDDIVEGTPEAEEKPEDKPEAEDKLDKQDPPQAEEKPDKHPGCPQCAAEAKPKPAEEDTEEDSQSQTGESQDATQPLQEGTMPYAS